MPLPDAALHNPDPAYARELIARSGLTQREAGRRIGVGERQMRYYCSGGVPIPYPAQFCLEALAGAGSVND